MRRLLIVTSFMIITTLTPFVLMLGCSSHKTTSVTTEVSSTHSQEYGAADEDTESPLTQKSVTTTTEKRTEQDDGQERHGVFGILFDVIALPFRAIGALFGAIF